MPLHDFECAQGHQTEATVRWDQEWIKCPQCGKRAERAWMAGRSKHRQLAEPIVLHRLPDGSYSFPGRSDAKAPAGAERIEVRTWADYGREMRRANDWLRDKAQAHDERLHEVHEAYLSTSRSELRTMMAQTDDPLTKDLCRYALEKYGTDRPESSYGAVYNEAMEWDRSNRDEYWDPSTGMRGKR